MTLTRAECLPADAILATPAHMHPETMLTEFIGPRSSHYLAHFRRTDGLRANDRPSVMSQAGPRLAVAWHWAAFFLTIPWLFYRKMYLGGIVLVVLPVLFDHIAPGSLFFGSGFFIAVCTGLYAKSWYLTHALEKVDAATARFADSERRLAYARHAGGVSVPGAIFGTLTQGFTIFLALRDLLNF